MIAKSNFTHRTVHPSSARARSSTAFTLVELVVLIALAGVVVLLLVPASAHLRPESQIAQCQNNLRQMSRAWMMYSEDNSGKIVSSYPNYSTFAGTWCAGDAETGGAAGTYVYSGADPAGIQHGLLWPYLKALGPYHCPTDRRVASSGAPAQFVGKPILRSIAMNSFLYGTGYGVLPYNPVSGGTRDPSKPIYLTEAEIQLPRQTFVFVDEDQQSINDSMLFMDVGGSRRFLDLPSRAHQFGYSISFADGHVELYRLIDSASRSWSPGSPGGLNDWMRLTNVTTHPL